MKQITCNCQVGMKSADWRTRSNAFCNCGLNKLLSCMLRIWPIFRAAPKKLHITVCNQMV